MITSHLGRTPPESGVYMLHKIASKLLRIIIGNTIKINTDDLNQLTDLAIAKLIAPVVAKTIADIESNQNPQK